MSATKIRKWQLRQPIRHVTITFFVCFQLKSFLGKSTTLLGAEEKRFRLSEMICEYRKRFADRNDFQGGPLDNGAAVTQLAYPPTAR